MSPRAQRICTPQTITYKAKNLRDFPSGSHEVVEKKSVLPRHSNHAPTCVAEMLK